MEASLILISANIRHFNKAIVILIQNVYIYNVETELTKLLYYLQPI